MAKAFYTLTSHMPTKKIRLAILTDTFAPWSNGGRESRFSELLPHLAGGGMEITVYTMRWWAIQPPICEIGNGSIRLRAICAPRPLYVKGRRSLLHAIVFSLNSLRLLFEPFDVIETDSIPFFHLPVVWLVSKIRRRPLVVVWHEVWGKSYWREYLGNLGVFGHWIERRSTHFGDVVVAVSNRTFQQLSDLGVDGQRLILAENAVRHFPQVVNTDSPELLFVGRLIEHKRPDLVIGALNDLSDLQLRLCMVGSGPMRTTLEKQTMKFGLSERVTFLGSVNDEELGILIQNAKILLSPSEREGYGLVVAEALSLGTPVVTVDARTNAAKDLVLDGVNGRVCHAGSAACIANAVRELIERPLARSDVIRAWESLGSPSSYEEVADQLLLVYRRVASAN
jgi:glycosyltransferase involved in cell wall biosynthesis